MEQPHPLPNFSPRPRFPEVVAFTAPRGTRATLRQAADAAGTTVAALMRDALRHALANQHSAGRAA